jgi:hypothetical protein
MTRSVPVQAWGQRFEVVEADSAVHPGQSLVVVPWGYGPNCGPLLWSESFVWVDPGAEVVFFLPLLDDGVEGFDVLGWHYPYPTCVLIEHEAPGIPERDEWMTASEYYDLARALPDDDLWDSNPEAGKRQLESWAREHPATAEKFPFWLAITPWQRESAGRL